MRFLVIACVLLFSLAAHGQSAVRRIASLTNLVAGIDPAAVDTGSKVSYLVDGYYTAGDWGTAAREFTATKTAGTTNFAHLIRSTKNTNYYWRSSDASDPVQDIRKWGAVMSDGLDDSDKVQAAINFCNGQLTVFFPAGVTKLESTLTFPADYQRFDAAGFNANIQVAHNGNAFEHLGVTNGQPRRYGLEFRNLRLTTAVGYTPEAAWRVDDVSFSLWENCYVTQGSGVGFNRAWSSFGHYDIPNAIYGGNWGNTIRGGEYYNKAGGDFVIWGSGGPSGTGGPNDLRVLDSYVSGGLSGSPTNGATGSIYLNNCNMVRIVNTDMEAFGTNGVWFGTNVQSATVLNNRFELQGGSSATRHCIRFDEYTTQGHIIAGNMMLIQGGGGSGTRIYGPAATPTMVPATIFEPSFEGASQILADTLLVGTNLDFVARTFSPLGNKVIVMDKVLGKTNSIVVGTYDGTVNPRLSMSQIGTNDNRISSGSAAQSIPLSIYGNDLMAWIGPSGSGILGTNRPGNEFTVYGDATFGSDPFSPFIGGWTTTPDLVAIRSAGTNRIGFWAGSIDGIDNRRVEVSVDPVADTATFQHTYSAGGGTTLHKVGNNTVFQLTDSLLTVNTNTTFIPGVTITVGNQVPQSRKEWPVDWVNVLDYGALINSTNDSTAAFQSAVDSGAAVVYVPNGYYALRSTLTITNDVRLLGDHQDTTRLLYYGTNYAIQIGGGTNFNSAGAQLENLFVIGWADFPYNGSYALSNALGLIRVSGATLGSIKNVRTSNARTGSGLLFDRRAYYFDVDNYRSFDTYAGINFQCVNPGAGDLVDTINVRKSLTSGCDWGVLIGDTNAPSGLLERGIATIRFEGGSIEGNRRGGMWINQAEVVDVSMYWEGNGNDATIGEGVNIRLGNQLDTNSWSVSAIKITGNRFATQTNSVQVYSANNVLIDGNDHQGVRGTSIVFATSNHFNVHLGPNEYARQNYTDDYFPSVSWVEGEQSSVVQYKESPVRGSYRLESSSAVFGDSTGSALLTNRVHNAGRFVAVNSTNGGAEVSAQMIGQTGFPGVYMRTDGTEAVFGGQYNSGTMPIAVEMNTTRYLTLDVAQSVHPNRFVIGETNGLDKLTVYGDGVFGDPSVYAGFTDLDSRVAVVSTNMAEQIGLFLFGADGANNRRAYAKLDLSVPEYVTGVGYSGGGEIPYIIRSGTANDIATFLNSGVTIRNGAGLTLGGETITDLTGTGITIVGGALTATSTPYTSFWPDLTNALIAGANIAFAYDTGNETITISSSGGGGATNGSAVSVDGTYLSALNLADSAELGVTASGTNVTYALVSGSVATNKIDSTFYAWVNSKGGNVYANGTSITNIKSSPSILFSTAAQEVTLALSNTAVTPGTYSLATVTVDAQGRITSAASGSTGTNALPATFGEIYVHTNTTAQILTNAGTYYLLNSFNKAGNLAGVSVSSSNRLQVLQDGYYHVNFGVSFSGTGNATFEIGVFTNGTEAINIDIRRKLGTGGDVGAAAGSGVLNLLSNDIVDIRAAGSGASDSIKLQEGNLSVMLIASPSNITDTGFVYVDGAKVTNPNFTNSTKIDPSVSGTNVSFTVVANSLTTNDISSAFYTWVDSKGTTAGVAYTASNNVFTGTNTFTGPITGNVFSVSTLILANPIGLTAIGTNLADAQDELQLTPGVYTMAYDLDLLQLATMTWTNGVMAYHNGSTITGLVSTSTGRSLLTASSATNARDVLEVGQLDQSAYGAGWDGVTNATPTLNALYDKIQSLPGGSNNISSWNTNYFSVTGGYLDWVGPSGGSGGGVTWVGNYGLSPLTNAATTTNVLLASFIVTTNKTVSTDGRFLEGGLDLMLTNASSLTVAFNLRTKVNGTTVADLQRSMATATTPEFHTTRFRLIRESSTTAHLTLLGERWGGSLPTTGYGTFGSSGGEDLIVATNIAWNWGSSNTLDIDIGMSWTGSPTTNAIGVQRIAASLYNPGDGSTGGSSETNLVFTVNGVTFDPVIITNSSTVTWATNANGHIQATAAGGGSGSGTNIFVNNVLIQPAKLTNSATVTWSTNSNGDIVATAATVTNSPVSGLWQKWGGIEMVVTNNNTIGDIQSQTLSGYVSAISVVGSGANTAPLLVDVTFSQSRNTNYLVVGEFESTTTDIGYTYWVEEGTRASNSVRIGVVSTDLSVFATPGRKMRFTIIEPDATAGGSGGNVYTSSNNVFTGANTFNGSVLLGSTNIATELAGKQGLNANLTTVANLTSGTSTNFLAGDGTFKQVTTNMIPGLNAALASAGGGVRMLFSAFAKDFISGTNASAQALDVVRGDGRRFARFSGSTDNERLFEGVIPPSANLAGGLKITLHFSSTNTVGSNVVWQLQLAPGTGVDPTSTTWNTAAKLTNALPGSVAITNAALNYSDLASITNRQPIIGRVVRDQGSASDTESGNVDLRAVVLEILDTN